MWPSAQTLQHERLLLNLPTSNLTLPCFRGSALFSHPCLIFHAGGALAQKTHPKLTNLISQTMHFMRPQFWQKWEGSFHKQISAPFVKMTPTCRWTKHWPQEAKIPSADNWTKETVFRTQHQGTHHTCKGHSDVLDSQEQETLHCKALQALFFIKPLL